MTGVLRHRRGEVDLGESPAIVGVVNVTPDSFSDGGRYLDPNAAVAHALSLVAQGATIVDVGGESTRPSAEEVGSDEQIARVVPVVRALVEQTDAVISVDTTSSVVAAAAIAAGADIINDISGLTFDSELAQVVASTGAGLIVMHTPGRPSIMQSLATYRDVVATVRTSLERSVAAAREAGIDDTCIAVDPGFGFGKNASHNAELFDHIEDIVAIGFPVMVGVSRKRMLRELVGEDELALDVATAMASVLACERGATLLRVHNVAATRAALAAYSALSRGR